ncbi:MAG: histone deacetylase [Spirochaetes bacterium]|nr:histone deacetylase [Spirochaetota bacterium]
MNKKLPIIYSPHYNITLFGIEKLHSFDSEKYGKVFRYLKEKMGLKKYQFYEPEEVTEEDLLLVHTKEYLHSLSYSKNIARIAELDLLSFFPNFILKSRILKPMKYGTGGTILGCHLALKHGWAINLSGGYHHAKSGEGGGFCFYSDVPIAVYKLLKKKKMKILIIDLDAHQGNGFESVFKNDQRIYIFDIYNSMIYPMDNEVKQYIDCDYPVSSFTKDSEYLKILKEKIPFVIKRSSCDLIIYNAGTDIFKDDPLGHMNITTQGIIQRDEMVFRQALKRKIPILMVLSGGYTKQSSLIIGKSIENLLKNVIGVKTGI